MGSKSGDYISPKTMQSALSIWVAVSFFYAFFVLYYYNIPMSEITSIINELGMFSLIILAVVVVVFLISYVAFKFGEKMGIKTFLQKKAKAEKLESNS